MGPGDGRTSGLALAGRLVGAAGQRRVTLGVAEADTGGLVLAWLTAWPGSSAVVRGGVVPYANDLKRDLLAVDAAAIAEHGAVSAAVVEALAAGVRVATGADLGLATTGIAGPDGARPGKPVGLAWVAVAAGPAVVSRQHRWHGGRASNRRASGRAVLRLALELLEHASLSRVADAASGLGGGLEQGENAVLIRTDVLV